MSFTHIQANSKDAQITTVRPVDQLSHAIPDNLRTGGNQFKEQQDDSESQTMEFEYRTQVGAFQIKAIAFKVAEHFFNGLITNDKFCMIRTSQLRLNHWRRPLRLRTSITEKKVYSASEKSECGGNHETPVENSSGSARIPERTEPMGSCLSLVDGDSSRSRNKTDKDDQSGGATCE